MSILFVLLTFLLFVSISYFRGRQRGAGGAGRQVVLFPALRPQMVSERGFEIPKGYCFHPAHAWVLDEGRRNARVGMDSLAATLLGKIDRIEVVGLNRWVRQGQKLCMVTADSFSVDILSPVEGVIIGVNSRILQDPGLVAKDPYGEGWIAVVQSPDLPMNLKNLIKGSLVRPWMQDALDRLGSLPPLAGAVARDGGVPMVGALAKLEPELRQRLIKELFLN